jgi:hypothetical protein
MNLVAAGLTVPWQLPVAATPEGRITIVCRTVVLTGGTLLVAGQQKPSSMPCGCQILAQLSFSKANSSLIEGASFLPALDHNIFLAGICFQLHANVTWPNGCVLTKQNLSDKVAPQLLMRSWVLTALFPRDLLRPWLLGP